MLLKESVGKSNILKRKEIMDKRQKWVEFRVKRQKVIDAYMK